MGSSEGLPLLAAGRGQGHLPGGAVAPGAAACPWRGPTRVSLAVPQAPPAANGGPAGTPRAGLLRFLGYSAPGSSPPAGWCRPGRRLLGPAAAPALRSPQVGASPVTLPGPGSDPLSLWLGWAGGRGRSLLAAARDVRGSPAAALPLPAVRLGWGPRCRGPGCGEENRRRHP